MKIKQGGTKMFCPHCKRQSVCSSRSLSAFRDGGIGQHWEHRQHKDLQWFRRGRVCLSCYSEFVTGEVTEAVIFELVKVRDALASIKTSVTVFSKQSTRTAKALKSLDDTLAALQILSLYEDPEGVDEK